MSVVLAQSVTMGVGVGEDTSLEHLVHGGFNSRNEVTWTEGALLHILEVVFGVLVEHQPTHILDGVVGVWPHLSHVEDVPLVLVTICFRHHLDLHRPGKLTTLLDGFKEITLGVICVDTFNLYFVFFKIYTL